MSTDNPFEDDKAPETKPKAEAKTEAPKRRSKEEKLADDINEAKALLVENGYAVIEDGKPGGVPEGTEDEAVEFDTDKFPITAREGDIAGSLDTNSAGLPVAKLSPVPWVGPEPLIIGIAQLPDLAKVVRQLIKDGKKVE